jgi:hypothetical protein
VEKILEIFFQSCKSEKLEEKFSTKILNNNGTQIQRVGGRVNGDYRERVIGDSTPTPRSF